jgi:Fanconi-associated nuclease 1
MLPEILTSSHKRAYPSEIRPHRSIIWQTRDALLEYERALEMEAIVDESLGEQNHSSGAWVGPSGYGFGTTGGRVEGARRVRKVWEGVYAKWKAAAHGEGSGKVTGSRHILDRFTLGESLDAGYPTVLADPRSR